MSDDLLKTYCDCMEDVKRRLATINTVVEGNFSTGSELFDYEFVSIHLRKSLELIAFASITANKSLYAEAYANFSEHWKAKLMLTSLEKLHPDFYPQPVFLDHVTESGVKHLELVKDGYLTQEDFVILYDLCCEVLHTWNPFTEKEKHINFKLSVAEWVQRIKQLLKLHFLHFVDRDEVWVVDMENSKDGRVHTFRAQ